MAIDVETLSVLVVTNSLSVRKLLLSVLEAAGIQKSFSARNGQEGFDLFCTHAPGLVLADWKMAPVSGIELTTEIRHNPRSPNRRTPVVLITAGSTGAKLSHEIFLEARDAGVTGLVLKPFSAADLTRRITQVSNDPRDFIECPNYWGPDRRRRKNPDYAGPFRRATDYGHSGEKP